MKYCIVELSSEEFDVLVEDGGITSVHKSEDGAYQSTYYQNRIDVKVMKANNLYDDLTMGKMYYKDWSKDTDKDEVIKDALSWLVCPPPNQWTKTDHLFKELFS